MILQQYYTRERRGIFRTTEGYDTIAKSPSLDNNLIKKVFHSYCFYDPPRELQISGEKDALRYPQALTFLQLDTNEAILGQSVYVPVDFTGQRSTFFSHNYLVPKDSKEDFIKQPEKIVYANEFATSYDIERGMNLQELSHLSYAKQSYDVKFVDDLFKELGITEKIFKDLLYAIAVSVTSRKKVYIALDVEAEDISKYSKPLLLCILESLPYEIRRVIGFISYIQKPESKKNINIMFVDKESIRHSASGTERDFVFDFSTGRFPSIETDQHPYLDFIWNNRGNKSTITSLYEFIDQVLKGTKIQGPTDISVYNQLTILYQVIIRNQEIYHVFKNQIFVYILSYIDKSNANKQTLLNDLATRLIKEELDKMTAEGAYVDIKFAQTLIPYYDFASEEDKFKICRLFLVSLLNAKRLGRQEYMATLFETVHKNNQLVKMLITEIMKNGAIKDNLLNNYLGLRQGAVLGLNQWMKEIESLRNISLEIISDPYFQAESIKKLLMLLQREGNIIFSARKIYKHLKDFNPQYAKTVETHLDQFILGEVSISTITKYDLDNLRISQANTSTKARMLDALKDFVTLGNSHSIVAIKNILRQVGEVEKQELQNGIKNLSAELSGAHFYEALLLAFYNGSSYANGEYDYGQLLNFIYSQKGKEKVYHFILWSVNSKEFTDARGNHFNRDYVAALKNYFVKKDPKVFENKDVKKQFYDIKKPGMRKVFVDINYELASGFKKILLRHGKKAARITVLAVLMGGLIAGVSFGTIQVVEFFMEKGENNQLVDIEIDEEPIEKDPIDFSQRNDVPIGYMPPGYYLKEGKLVREKLPIEEEEPEANESLGIQGDIAQ